MKTKFTLVMALFSFAAAFAADPVVKVNSATDVTLNGQPAGSVVDVLANNPSLQNLRARLLDAWLAYETRSADAVAAKEKSLTDSFDKKQKETTAALEKLFQEKTVALEKTFQEKNAQWEKNHAAEDRGLAEAEKGRAEAEKARSIAERKLAGLAAILRAVDPAKFTPEVSQAIKDTLKTDAQRQREELQAIKAEAEKRLQALPAP